MMHLFDARFSIDGESKIFEISWENPSFQNQYENLWNSFLHQNVEDLFDFSFRQEFPLLFWNNEAFLYTKQKVDNSFSWLFLKKYSNREYLYQQALNHIPDGIQIYDQHACAVFFNNNSRKLSDIPRDVTVEGRHLLDLYHLDEGISTVITSLRNRGPVINRVDRFKSKDGTEITTANTAYPIFQGKNIVGSVVFEQDANVVKSRIRQLESTQKALESHSMQTHINTFSGYTFENIIGKGAKLLVAITLAKRIATQSCHVLLAGETGTGKEVFAQSIHRESNRRTKQFIAINCAAIPDTLIESLLFGTTKGSFTGSLDKPGYLEEANGGTLFLDELNSMSLSMQSKLLRVIQENTFRRLGGSKDIPADIRIISSCNEDPFAAISENRLRKDLFYRLSTVMIELPPLREHMKDLEELIYYHLEKNSHLYVNPIQYIQPEVLSLLQSYDWPGNVRELFHVLDYIQNVADGDTMEFEHLPPYIQSTAKNACDAIAMSAPAIDFNKNNLQSLMDDYENLVLKQALEHYGGNITKTAAALGIRRQSLQYRIRKYGIII